MLIMANPSRKFGLLSRKVLLGTTLGVALFFMIVGVIFWGGFNTFAEYTNPQDTMGVVVMSINKTAAGQGLDRLLTTGQEMPSGLGVWPLVALEVGLLRGAGHLGSRRALEGRAAGPPAES